MTEQFNTFIIRPPTQDDIPAIVDMLNAYALDMMGTQPESVADYQRLWHSPGYEATLDSRIATTEKGDVVGLVNVFTGAPYVRNWIWVGVHPQYRGRGLGTRLTEWGEARGRERIPEAPDDARVIASSGTVSTFQPAAELLRNLGYQHIRSFYAMKIEMDAPPPAPMWPRGITIQSMAPGQEEAVYRAQLDAFKDHWGYVESPFDASFQRWQHFVTNNAHYDPSVFFLAMDGAEIAGIAICFPQDNEFPDMAWVEDLGVRRPWRWQGLALALLHHAFGEFYHRGIKKVGLGVDASSLTGATKLYEKAGMYVFRQQDSYEKELRPGRDLSTQSVE